MIFLFSLLLFSVWLFHRISKKAAVVQGVDVRIVSRHYLSPKSFLCIVDVDGERMLLGVSDNGGIRLISYVDRDKEFKTVLNHTLGQREEKNWTDEGKENYDAFIREVDKQLKELKESIQKRISDA